MFIKSVSKFEMFLKQPIWTPGGTIYMGTPHCFAINFE